MRSRRSRPKRRRPRSFCSRLGANGKTLVIDVAPDEGFARAARNLVGVRLVASARVTARDVTDTTRVIATRAADREAAGAVCVKLTHIIRRPLLTEKTANLKEERQTVVFEVAAGATKVDIKRAVEQLLGAKVANVRTALVHGKVKRQGRFAGRRPDWKKAYVRLRDGEKMPEFLEGA